MKQEFPTAYAAASRVPLYPSDAHSWDVHGGAVVSPTMHLLPVAKRLEDMVGRLYVDFVKKADDNYAALLDRSVRLKAEFSNDLAVFSAAVEARLKSVEDVIDGKLSDELDPVFTRWLDGRTFVETEVDPVFTEWLAGRTFVETEADPVFTAWLSRTTLAPPDAQSNVIETVKVNGEALTVAGKSVDVSVPDAYTKDETDTMLAAKADEFTEWKFSNGEKLKITCTGSTWSTIDGYSGVAEPPADCWYGDGDADAMNLTLWWFGLSSQTTKDPITATRKRVLYTDDVQPRGDGTVVIATIGGKDIKVSDDGVKKVANVAPDANGNVPLAAGDIGALPQTGGDVGTTETAGRLFLRATYEQAPSIALDQAFQTAGSIYVPDSALYRDTGAGPRASIKKGGEEVATEEQVESAKSELNARIDLIEKTSHPNMNIVGSPKFSEGVVSGFSANDYLMFPTQVDVGQNSVDFYMHFTTGSDVSAQQNILDSWCGLALAVQDGCLVLAASSDGTSFVTDRSDSQIGENSSHSIRISFLYEEGLEEYRVSLYLDGMAGAECDVALSAPLHPTATYWGGANPQSGVHHIFGGTINLNECRMVWNGTEVWRGYDELPTVKFDPTAEPRLDTAEKIVGTVSDKVDEIAAYPMLTMVNGAAKDRTVNISPNGGTITFPARTGDNARDFVVRVSSSDTAPSITFPSDVNYESDQDDCWTADAGKANEWYFSESEPGLFKVMHKALTPVSQ